MATSEPPSSTVHALLRDLREHADAFEAESEAFRRRAEALAAAHGRASPAVMGLWNARVSSWLALFEAYVPTADQFAKRGEAGLRAYVDALLAWVSMLKPDADDLRTESVESPATR